MFERPPKSWLCVFEALSIFYARTASHSVVKSLSTPVTVSFRKWTHLNIKPVYITSSLECSGFSFQFSYMCNFKTHFCALSYSLTTLENWSAFRFQYIEHRSRVLELIYELLVFNGHSIVKYVCSLTDGYKLPFCLYNGILIETKSKVCLQVIFRVDYCIQFHSSLATVSRSACPVVCYFWNGFIMKC